MTLDDLLTAAQSKQADADNARIYADFATNTYTVKLAADAIDDWLDSVMDLLAAIVSNIDALNNPAPPP